MTSLTGTIIETKSGRKYQLGEEVGRGAQGVVYAETTGKYLVKLFNRRKSLDTMLSRLKKLMSIQYPPRFIKPVDMIEQRTPNGELVLVGYVMLKVVDHIPLNRLLIPPKDLSFSNWYNTYSGGLKRRLYLAYQIAMNFYLLHRNGIAYCDISGGNILVAEDSRVASVCMIDIDNLYSPGYDTATVLGTSRYMAPEILNDQMQPDILTDDYSLAVIIFELLKGGHPFIGDYVQSSPPEVEELAFRGKLPYIGDPINKKNRATDVLPDEVVFNDKLRKAFEKTFTRGITNRMERTTSLEWAKMCLEASNALIKCTNPKCNAWHYPNKSQKVDVKKYQCPWCDGINELEDYAVVYRRYPHVEGSTLGAKKSNAIAVSTIILEDGVVNPITDNYIYYTITDESICKKQTRFNTPGNINASLCVAKIRGRWIIKNLSDKVFFIRPGNVGELKGLAPNVEVQLNNGDSLYFELRSSKDDYSFDEVLQGSAVATTFIQFRFW